MIALIVIIIEKEHDTELTNLLVRKFNERWEIYNFKATTICTKVAAMQNRQPNDQGLNCPKSAYCSEQKMNTIDMSTE